jgi:mannose-6-phosphate isomerase-like protein (cupin superfamily)
MTDVTVTPWGEERPPNRDRLELVFRREGLSPSWWSNGPGDRYSQHSHSYHKVLYCARGSIRFMVHPSGEAHELQPGDRLDIPPGTTHSADVGPEGVTCVEARA